MGRCTHYGAERGADGSFKTDRGVVLEAVKQDGDALEYASEDPQQDEELKKLSEG